MNMFTYHLDLMGKRAEVIMPTIRRLKKGSLITLVERENDIQGVSGRGGRNQGTN